MILSIETIFAMLTLAFAILAFLLGRITAPRIPEELSQTRLLWLLKLSHSWIKYPSPKICKHFIVLGILEGIEPFCDPEQYTNLIRSVIDADDEQSLHMLSAMIHNLKVDGEL